MVLSFVFNAHQIVSQILFLGVPALILAALEPRAALKALIFGLVFVPLWLFVEHVMQTTGQWHAISIFPERFLGSIAYDAITWFLLAQLYIVMFWEYFFESHKRIKVWQRRMTPLIATLSIFLVITIVLLLWAPKFLQIPYFYLLLTIIVFILPLVMELKAHPNLLPKFLKVSAYFIYAFTVYEVTAIALGQWYYPSTQFIGWVELFGQRFPFEEFVSWILIGSMTCLAWYEHFDDDEH